MHIDLNSCFASIEQQANPFLRGIPIAVAAYDSPNGVILAPSIEAKTYGIKTGFRIKDAKLLCPHLLVLTPDPNKYRFVHSAFQNLLEKYSPEVYPKSIDEFVLDFKNQPDLNLHATAKIIKRDIKKYIGDWLKVSIGIGPSRFMAKTASNYQKPDGLVEINYKNFLQIYQELKLTDLHGINIRNQIRLNSAGIYTVLGFYNASFLKSKIAFQSINSYYWYLRLRGYEIDGVEFTRRTFGHSYSLPHHDGNRQTLLPYLQKLVEKTGTRLRKNNYTARGIHLGLNFKNLYWHKSATFQENLYDSRDLFKKAVYLLENCPYELPVRKLAVNCFDLKPRQNLQLDLFIDQVKKQKLVSSIDKINSKWQNHTVHPARMLLEGEKIQDRIAFGNSML